MNDELFQITETKPTPLQAARRALAESEKALSDAIDRYGDDADYKAYERAVQRSAEIVKAEELAELNNSKKTV
jgi:hypothetical protein